MDVFDRHQLRIARDTLKMSDAGAAIMGGMDKEAAKAVILRLTGRPFVSRKEKARRARIFSETPETAVQRIAVQVLNGATRCAMSSATS